MGKKGFPALLALWLLLSGCTASVPPEAAFAPPPEDRLVIYTSHKEEVYDPIVKEFQARTGIWVEVIAGGTNELLERISAESGDPACDVMFGGGVESLSAYADCFQPYVCRDDDCLNATGRSPDNLWTPFSSLPIVLIYNTRLVAPGEITGWSDLLREQWRGRIALADPTISGSGYTAVRTLMSCLPGDPWDTLTRFVENLDGNILPDSGDIAESVRSGSCYVGITLEETALKARDKGADLAIVYPREGTSAVPDGGALVSGAPHLENAKAFLDFVLGYDVQKLLVSSLFRRSVRTDIPEPEDLPTESELGVINYDISVTGGQKEEFIRRWQELLGETP